MFLKYKMIIKMSIYVNEKGRPVYKVYEASLNARVYFFENDAGFIFFGSAVTSKYTRSMEPTLSNKLLNNFGKKEAAKMLAPLCFKNITATSEMVPVKPPYTAIPIGVPISGATIPVKTPIKIAFKKLNLIFLNANPTTKATAMLTSANGIPEKDPLKTLVNTLVAAPTTAPYHGPKKTAINMVPITSR